MGLCGTVIVILLSYAAIGIIKAYANYDSICEIKERVDKNAVSAQAIKEQAAKDVGDIKERIARIEANTQNTSRNTELLLKMIERNNRNH